jgi:hypothetical protein
MNAQQQRRNTAVAVTIIVLVLLAVLGIALFFLLQKKPGPAPTPSPSPATATPSPEPTPTPAPPASHKLLGIHTVIRHDTLWWISDKWYKDPVLWPSIYEINKNEIRDPDLIFPGQKFDIPALTGSVGNLSPEDKTLLSQGYLEAYRVYKEKGRQDAADYKRTGDKLAK